VHRYRAPVEIMHAALTTDLHRWLLPQPGEVEPTVVASQPNSRVVWSSMWPVSPDDTVEFDLWREVTAVDTKTAIRFRWFSSSPPDARGIAITRQRLNRKLGGNLRGIEAEFFWSTRRLELLSRRDGDPPTSTEPFG
jgi:hypothetical protein